MRKGTLVEPSGLAWSTYLFESIPTHDRSRFSGELRRGRPGVVVDVDPPRHPMDVERVLVLVDGGLGWTTTPSVSEVKE